MYAGANSRAQMVYTHTHTHVLYTLVTHARTLQMLRALHVESAILISDDARQVQALSSCGIQVVETQPRGHLPRQHQAQQQQQQQQQPGQQQRQPVTLGEVISRQLTCVSLPQPRRK